MARFDRTIPPGEEGKISLEVRTKGYQGQVHRTARVMTNDPKNPQVTIGMKGKVWAPIHISPSYVQLRGISGEMIEKVVNVRAEKEEPLTVELASVSIPDKVEVELIEAETGRAYQLKVRNKAEKEMTYKGQVKLTTNYPEKSELVVQIAGYIRAPVEARPKVLRFGSLSGERVKELEKTGKLMKLPVTVFLNIGEDLEIQKVEVQKSLFEVVTKEMQPGRKVQLLVTPILKRLKKGPNTDLLIIHTNQKDYEILEVPIHFEIS